MYCNQQIYQSIKDDDLNQIIKIDFEKQYRLSFMKMSRKEIIQKEYDQQTSKEEK